MKIERPWCCPEPRCVPLHQLKDHEAKPLSEAQPGQSFICFGRARGIQFIYDGVEHENDLRSCHHSALKGVVAYQENAEDWRVIAGAYTGALGALGKEPK